MSLTIDSLPAEMMQMNILRPLHNSSRPLKCPFCDLSIFARPLWGVPHVWARSNAKSHQNGLIFPDMLTYAMVSFWFCKLLYFQGVDKIPIDAASS